MHLVSVWIEFEAVLENEVRIVEKVFGASILRCIQVGLNGAKVHRLLNDLVVVGNVQRNRVNGNHEWVSKCLVLLLQKLVHHVQAEFKFQLVLLLLWAWSSCGEISLRWMDFALGPIVLRRGIASYDGHAVLI